MAVQAVNPEAERSEPRRPLSLPLSARLFRGDEEIEFRGLDVSKQGFGVFSMVQLDQLGETFRLSIADLDVKLELAWTKQRAGDGLGYRHGFRVVDTTVDLEEVCRRLGNVPGV